MGNGDEGGARAGLDPGGERRTGGGPRPVAAMLDRLIARSGRRRGFGEARILTEWAAVVGPELAACTRPERLRRGRAGEPGTLLLAVESGWGPEVQHLGPVILERVNGFLGHRAVARLSLRQVASLAPRGVRRPARRTLSAAERARLDAATGAVADPELAAALRALGEAVLTDAAEP